MTRPTRALISQRAIQHNLSVVRKLAPSSRIMAVVKADAYGHSASLIAKTLAHAGVDAFAVACLEEALQLRRQEIALPIFLLEGPFSPADIADIARFKIGLVLHTRRQIKWLRELPPHAAVDVFVKVDTGMHRLGFPPAELPETLKELQALPRVRIRGFMSHLARADFPNDPYNKKQADLFLAALDYLPRFSSYELSLANSAAVLRLPETHHHWVRPGLMLYGMSPLSGGDGPSLGLRPVLELRSEIIAIQDLKPGDWLGYGDGYCADSRLRAGVVAIGYGDGYPRRLGNGTPAIVQGQRTRLLGRVSMDMLFVDLTHLPEAEVGDEVVLIGNQNGESVTVEELAMLAGTIPYELTCRIQGRVPRLLAP